MHEKPLNRTAPTALESIVRTGPEGLQRAREGVGVVRVRTVDTENVVPPHHVV